MAKHLTGAPGKIFLPPLAPTQCRSTETGLKRSPIMVQHFPPCSPRPGVELRHGAKIEQHSTILVFKLRKPTFAIGEDVQC